VENGTSAPLTGREILDADALARTLARLAHELIERNDDVESLALVGIHTRGAPLARRLQGLVAERSGAEPLLGTVDITFHRDDVLVRAGEAPLRANPVVRGTELGVPPEGRTRVLVDRGHRELPIRPDYVGKNLPTALGERVRVELEEVDGADRVLLERAPEGRS
jgi:pyrimidine operon attenuation protein/uracil phosphoribosyltransferase